MPKEKLTAEHFYKFFQCPHWIWYDIYEDAKKKRQMPPLLEMIYRGKMPRAGEIIQKHKKFEEIKPEMYRDLDEALMATLELMKQGKRPKEAYVIDPQGNERSFLVDDFTEQFHLTREQIERILEGEKPAPFLKSGCKRTPWYSLCVDETQGCNDVSLIYRISQADQRRLYDSGIKTVADMANADGDDLQAKLEDWPFDKIVRMNNQAKALAANEPMILRKPEFPEVRHEVYLDIESDPTRDIDYLLGFLAARTLA